MDPHVTTSIAIAAIPSLLTLIIGLWVGRARDSENVIFNKKLEIYSNIAYHLSSAKYLRLNLKVDAEKLKSLIKEMGGLESNESDHMDPPPFDKEVEKLDEKLRNSDYQDELIKLFAPARLIGSRAVTSELREYFSLISKYHSIKEQAGIDNVSKKISKSVMELEQLMRKDLGRGRLLSKIDIWWHLRKK